jgi:hypothetical protein
MALAFAPFRRAPVIVAGILAVGAALAACGGAPSSQGPAGGTAGVGAHGSHGTGLLAYASCMRSHGVPRFPDPTSKGGIPKTAVISAFRAVSSSRAQAAQNACRHLLPPTGSLSGRANPFLTAPERQDYLKAAACMRSHGFTDFPDPTFPNGHLSLDIPASIDTHSAQFTQAAQVCTKLIPPGLPDGRGSGG